MNFKKEIKEKILVIFYILILMESSNLTILPLVDFSQVKKKKTIKPQTVASAPDSYLSEYIIDKKKPTVKVDTITIQSDSTEPNIPSDDYTYDFLLDRICQLIKTHNPKINDPDRGSIKIPIPVVNLVGKSRSAWMNFNEVVLSVNRQQDHIFQYVVGELGVEGTIGGENQLLLKSRVTNKHIEQILRKYIHDYVQCPNCKSFSTVIKKDNSARLQVIACDSCKSEKTIQPIKSTVKSGKK